MQGQKVAQYSEEIANCLNGTACFAAGTKLLAPDGPRAIEEFRVGDAITSRNEFVPNGDLR